MASSGQRNNPAAAGHGPHGRSRSQVPRHMLQIAMHCQPLLGDPSQLLMPKNESPKIIKDPKLLSGRRRRPLKGSPPSAAQTERAVFPHSAFMNGFTRSGEKVSARQG